MFIKPIHIFPSGIEQMSQCIPGSASRISSAPTHARSAFPAWGQSRDVLSPVCLPTQTGDGRCPAQDKSQGLLPEGTRAHTLHWSNVEISSVPTHWSIHLNSFFGSTHHQKNQKLHSSNKSENLDIKKCAHRCSVGTHRSRTGTQEPTWVGRYKSL